MSEHSMDEPKENALKRFSTKELTEELCKREGITTIQANLDDNIHIDVQEKNGLGHGGFFVGPALIIVNQD